MAKKDKKYTQEEFINIFKWWQDRRIEKAFDEFRKQLEDQKFQVVGLLLTAFEESENAKQ